MASINRAVALEVNAPMDSSGIGGHPRGLTTLFFTEMWERFSYYGMRAILILYLVAAPASGGLGFDTAKAAAIYGSYTSAAYLTAVPGGWLADRFLGARRAVLYGGILIALGHFSMALGPLSFFFGGMILIVVGTGLLKPNISTMVGALYSENDPRRDAGFSIFYMGINLGALISPAGLRLPGAESRLAHWVWRRRHWYDSRVGSVSGPSRTAGAGGQSTREATKPIATAGRERADCGRNEAAVRHRCPVCVRVHFLGRV